MPEFHYNNIETKRENGKTIVRKVIIRGGKGHKSVTIHSRKKRIGTAKRQLTEEEIRQIRARHFIPQLFADCKVNKKTCRKYPFAGSRKTTQKRLREINEDANMTTTATTPVPTFIDNTLNV